MFNGRLGFPPLRPPLQKGEFLASNTDSALILNSHSEKEKPSRMRNPPRRKNEVQKEKPQR